MKILLKADRESNRDFAFRVVRENIINLKLQPGSMISEQDIANELNLSRTPVHEALQELARTKIIEILPQRGSLVSLIDMSLVDEAVFVRATIEAAVTEQACKIATPEDIVKLEENVNLQEFYLLKENLDKIMELDNAFHESMYKITNKMLCHSMVKTINIHYDRFRELRLHTSDTNNIIQEHKNILQAFQNKAPEAAKECLLQHLNRHSIDEKDMRAKYPQYFA
ncbi:MAG: GntR family transcriptional regulator [Treponema sp.]|nr:GntR family transcriptional regulator [Treponema sp.]